MPNSTFQLIFHLTSCNCLVDLEDTFEKNTLLLPHKHPCLLRNINLRVDSNVYTYAITEEGSITIKEIFQVSIETFNSSQKLGSTDTSSIDLPRR